MVKYFFNGVEVNKPIYIYYNGFTYVNPSNDILKKAGYTVEGEEETKKDLGLNFKIKHFLK